MLSQLATWIRAYIQCASVHDDCGSPPSGGLFNKYKSRVSTPYKWTLQGVALIQTGRPYRHYIKGVHLHLHILHKSLHNTDMNSNVILKPHKNAHKYASIKYACTLHNHKHVSVHAKDINIIKNTPIIVPAAWIALYGTFNTWSPTPVLPGAVQGRKIIRE